MPARLGAPTMSPKESSGMGELRARDLTPAVFVGRQAELKLLLAGLDRAFERTGGMFLLSGEPGIGKTRLAEALTVEALRRGAAVFSGRSTQAEGAPPYWPWVQILRSLIRDVGEEEFGRLAGPALVQILQVVPELRGHFPDAPSASVDDEQARFRIYDSVTRVLLDAATKRPIVLVLDDMHWADVPTLLVLKLLAGSLAQSSVMVIATYRDRELPADNPLRAQLADFVRAGESTQIAITGLNRADVVQLFRALTRFDLDANMVHRLLSQTAGNPFFLSELAKAFATEDLDSTRWTASDSTDSIPSGVDAVLRRSVEGLSDDCRRILDVRPLPARNCSWTCSRPPPEPYARESSAFSMKRSPKGLRPASTVATPSRMASFATPSTAVCRPLVEASSMPASDVFWRS